MHLLSALWEVEVHHRSKYSLVKEIIDQCCEVHIDHDTGTPPGTG